MARPMVSDTSSLFKWHTVLYCLCSLRFYGASEKTFNILPGLNNRICECIKATSEWNLSGLDREEGVNGSLFGIKNISNVSIILPY